MDYVYTVVDKIDERRIKCRQFENELHKQSY